MFEIHDRYNNCVMFEAEQNDRIEGDIIMKWFPLRIGSFIYILLTCIVCT